MFIKNVTSVIYDSFLSGKYNKVVVFYNYYVNSIKQIIAYSDDTTDINLKDFC